VRGLFYFFNLKGDDMKMRTISGMPLFVDMKRTFGPNWTEKGFSLSFRNKDGYSKLALFGTKEEWEEFKEFVDEMIEQIRKEEQ
jgi:hypothetical protein